MKKRWDGKAKKRQESYPSSIEKSHEGKEKARILPFSHEKES
jgi:hypothetical protein